MDPGHDSDAVNRLTAAIFCSHSLTVLFATRERVKSRTASTAVQRKCCTSRLFITVANRLCVKAQTQLDVDSLNHSSSDVACAVWCLDHTAEQMEDQRCSPPPLVYLPQSREARNIQRVRASHQPRLRVQVLPARTALAAPPYQALIPPSLPATILQPFLSSFLREKFLSLHSVDSTVDYTHSWTSRPIQATWKLLLLCFCFSTTGWLSS